MVANSGPADNTRSWDRCWPPLNIELIRKAKCKWISGTAVGNGGLSHRKALSDVEDTFGVSCGATVKFSDNLR